jgi:hypothetical protein
MFLRFLAVALFGAVLAGCGPRYSGLVRGAAPLEVLARTERASSDQFAYEHTLGLSMPKAAIKPRFERSRDECLHDAALSSKLLSANIDLVGDADYSTSGDLTVTLPHDKIGAFEASVLAPVSGEATNDVRVDSRSSRAENVGQEASDTKQKLTQLTSYRDRLVAMSKRPGLSVDDLIKIESELSKTESDLDQAIADSRDVGNRVKLERVTISLAERPSVWDAGRPIVRVFHNAIEILGESTADAIDFVIRLVPWLPILAGAFFLLPWTWRSIRRRSASVSKS